MDAQTVLREELERMMPLIEAAAPDIARAPRTWVSRVLSFLSSVAL